MTNETDDSFDMEPSPYVYFNQAFEQHTHHFYLSGEIAEPIKYVNMIHTMHTAMPEDTILIHLNTPGGNLSTGIQIINAMQQSAAHIICSLEGEACSLGSLIFLAADEFMVHNNSLLMIHNYSGGTFGKANEQISELNASVEWFAGIAERYYVPFLSKNELNDVTNGGDIWLQAPDIRKRIKKMIKIINKDAKATSAG